MLRPADRPAAPEPAPPSLPLRYRLPNAPPLFVGRAEETAQLAAMIRRAPVSVVRGLGGLGKTSLVLHTLHDAFPEEAARTILVSLRPAEPPAAVEVEIMRALAAAHGPGKIEWSGLLADPEALLAAVLDHAEARGDWVVLEDLHHADGCYDGPKDPGPSPTGDGGCPEGQSPCGAGTCCGPGERCGDGKCWVPEEGDDVMATP